ncbi:ribonuclease H1-like [Belonocnema kinseyi]|uniref:ribonuclease H1-like n=1 Tax=Belonocnema kinseyi TaxID=2817044 RepID=UPI00143CCF44|nr:ribonuclease H1-like [Belonocnema kinseyi]
MSTTDDLDETYPPPAYYKKPVFDRSSIATRQRSCKRDGLKIPIHTRGNSSSEDALSEDSEHSGAPVYRKDYSVFPSLKPTLVTPSKEVTAKSAPPYLPNPCFPAQCSQPIDLYINETCTYINKGEPERGIWVWFGSDHSWNISKPAQGRQTNNSSEIQAATAAVKKAVENIMSKLTMFADTQFLIDSYTKWISTWETNGWKASDGKPVVNET